MAKRKRMKLTLKGRGAISGLLFIAPFMIGFIAFMAFPIGQSILYAFSDVRISLEENRFISEFIGLANFEWAFTVHPSFSRDMTEEITRMGLLVPAVIIFSLFIALLLNGKFKGRVFARAVFFLPVILASGILVNLEVNNSLMNLIAEQIRGASDLGYTITGTLESILIAATGATALGDFMEYVFEIINQIYTIAMASGIQILIFLSALQTIPRSMYEASSIEGATAWEGFWKITFPMLSPMLLVVIVYTIVDFLIRTDNAVMELARREILTQMGYNQAAVISWTYFGIVAAIMGVVCFIVSKAVYYYD